MSFISRVNLSGQTYNFHDSEFITDDRSAGGAALTGASKASALFDGMQITYWLTYAAGSNATLNLTLADGTTTGAIPCYYGGTTRMGTQYPAGNIIHFTYRENVTIGTTSIAAGWWADANYDTDSNTNYNIWANALKVDTAVYKYSLHAITGTGNDLSVVGSNQPGKFWKVNSFTQSGGTGATKKATTKGYYPWKIFYLNANADYTTADGNTSYTSGGTSDLDLRYTLNGTTSNIGVAHAPMFLVGTIGTDGLFYLKGNAATTGWWQCGVPKISTEYVYWFVGFMISAYTLRIADNNWMFKFVDGKFSIFNPLEGLPDFTDSEPYLLRQTGCGLNNYSNTKKVSSIIGGTICWNQLASDDPSGYSKDAATLTKSNNVFTLTPTVNSTTPKQAKFTLSSNHVYVFGGYTITHGTTVARIGIYVSDGTAIGYVDGGSSGAYVYGIAKTSANTDVFAMRVNNAATTSQYAEFKDVVLFDLTKMFGSDIADYVYSLETAVAGAGVAWFRQKFSKTYYTQNTGTLMSVKTSGMKSVGFNIYDGQYEDGSINSDGSDGSSNTYHRSKYIPVCGGVRYYQLAEGTQRRFYFYTADQQFIESTSGSGYSAMAPANACYLRVYWKKTEVPNPNQTVCVNVFYPPLNGTYQSYKTQEYALDNSLELRGLPKIGSGFYYDGDVYNSDGSVIRNYEYRAYASGDESLTNAITDGTHTVVKLANTTTESATSFTSIQWVDPCGTEEFIDYAVSQGQRDVAVPVGHNTVYLSEDPSVKDIINDEVATAHTTYSSNKIESLLGSPSTYTYIIGNEAAGDTQKNCNFLLGNPADLTEINSLISNVSTPICLFFKRGTYNLPTTLAIPSGKTVTLVGESRDTVILNCASNSSLAPMYNTNVPTMIGSGSLSYGASKANLVIKDMSLTSSYKEGYLIYAIGKLVVDNCKFTSNVAYADIWNGDGGLKVTNSEFNLDSSNTVGIVARNCSDYVVSGNKISGGDTAIIAGFGANDDLPTVNISAGVIKKGLTKGTGSGGGCLGEISNNYISGSNYGIYIGSRSIVRNNIFYKSEPFMIGVECEASHCIIDGNLMKIQFSNSSSTVKYGYKLTGNKIIFSNNKHFGDFTSYNYCYPLYCTGSYNTINGNIIQGSYYGYSSYEYGTYFSASATYNIITNNMFQITGDSTIASSCINDNNISTSS